MKGLIYIAELKEFMEENRAREYARKKRLEELLIDIDNTFARLKEQLKELSEVK